MHLPFLKKNKNIKPIVLLILDGFGIAPASAGNAITQAKTPNIDNIKQKYLYSELIASGESVGLPANEAGNSEVGHLTIGAGRVIYQSLPRINMSIEDGSFYDNRALNNALKHVFKFNSRLHIMGLISSGTVHSSAEHLYALLDFCFRNKQRNVCLHIFTDGRDAPPKDGIEVIEKIESKLDELKIADICTISGRYFAMDRDARWDRTKKTYDAIVTAKGRVFNSATEAVKAFYDSGITDEFIEPSIIKTKNLKQDYTGVNDNDAAVFFNFRIDRPRQLTAAFVIEDFEQIKTFQFAEVPYEHGRKNESKAGPTFIREKKPKNLYFVTMTEYQKDLPVSDIAFPPEDITDTLPELLSRKSLGQLHLAESEKERMVTFYFNGMKEEKFPGEDDLIIPSVKVATYDKKPEMSAYRITKVLKKNINKDIYNFLVVNFANPDMVAHSGDLKASIKAIETVDKCLGEIIKFTLNSDGAVFISADHGNAEELLTFPTGAYFFTTEEGSINTEHSNNPVPFYIISKNFEKSSLKLPPGSLADIAPTILAYMGIAKPEVMRGNNLLESFGFQAIEEKKDSNLKL